MAEQPLDYFEPEISPQKQPQKSKLYRFLRKSNIYVFPTVLFLSTCVYSLNSGSNLLGKLVSSIAFYLFWISFVTTIILMGVGLIIMILTVLKVIKSKNENIEYHIALFLSNIALIVYIAIQQIFY